MIFYEAIHQNIGNTVLIQEWKKTKNEQKKILERARELGDFAELKSLFQVNDYFEEDGKSYIVLEYPVGQTLREYVQKNGNIGEKELIRNILPFLKELSGVENAGIEDMAISCRQDCICPPGTARKCTVRRDIPGSTAFVPSVVGLIVAGEVIKDLAKK